MYPLMVAFKQKSHFNCTRPVWMIVGKTAHTWGSEFFIYLFFFSAWDPSIPCDVAVIEGVIHASQESFPESFSPQKFDHELDAKLITYEFPSLFSVHFLPYFKSYIF